MAETRKPGGGRKPSKPEYSAENHSLQSIADALSLNPIKVRKLLITAEIYESDIAKIDMPDKVNGKMKRAGRQMWHSKDG